MYLYPSRSILPSSKILLVIVFLLLFVPLSLSLQPQQLSVAPNTLPNQLIPQAIIQPAPNSQIADQNPILRFDQASQQFLGQHNANQWQIALGQEGLQIQSNDAQWSWNLQLQSYGRAGAMLGVSSPEITSHGQSVVYQWDSNLREAIHTKSAGIKQDFLLQAAPVGSGPLVLQLAVNSVLQGQLANGAISFSDQSGQARLSYSGLVVYDALGTTIPAHFAFASNQIQLIIDDQAARYPLLIDPLVEEGYLQPIANPNIPLAEFGHAVAIDGQTLVVGTWVHGGNRAYVFEREGDTWSEKAILKSVIEEDFDRFGTAVAISGDTIAIGAPCDGKYDASSTNDPNSCYGAVYIFTRTGSTWSQQAYLKASNRESHDFFGSSIALDGDTLVVGTELEDGDGSDPNDNSKPWSGAAYVFTRTGTSWSQQAYLKASSPEAEDFFGKQVRISGDTIAISAWETISSRSSQPYNTDPTVGTVYIFQRNGTSWTQQAALKVPNKAIRTWFGLSIALDNNTLAVGGYEQTTNSIYFDGIDSVYIFERNGNTWSQQAQLKASNNTPGDFFGDSVAISGDRVVVGAPLRPSDNTNLDEYYRLAFGAVYTFTRVDTTWSEEYYFKGSNTRFADKFGNVVDIDGDQIIVGVPGRDGQEGDPEDIYTPDVGAVYAFTITPNIDLSGNGNTIGNNSAIPSLSNGSALPDIQMGNTISQIFSIRNSTNAYVELAGPSFVRITGEHASDFKVTRQPSGRIAPGQSTSFTVEFTPRALGLRKATIQVRTTNPNEPAFTFNIQGGSVSHELNSFVYLPMVQK